jgi:hypothetical protein
MVHCLGGEEARVRLGWVGHLTIELESAYFEDIQ